MSKDTLTRIMKETDARVSAAADTHAVLAIGRDHVCRVGADYAETVFLEIRDWSALAPWQAKDLIQDRSDSLLLSLIDSFHAQGIRDLDLCEAWCIALGQAFRDRLNALVGHAGQGGRA